MPRSSCFKAIRGDVFVNMKTGAVALIDALGFKGIWQSHAPADVLKSLGHLKEVTDSLVRGVQRDLPGQIANRTGGLIGKNPFPVKVLFLSDTVFISCTTDLPSVFEPRPDALAGMTLFFVSQWVSGILSKAAQAEVPFVYRGAITFGQFMAEENFFVGPAVDRAAELMNKSDGAFVCLDPETDRLVELLPNVKTPDFWGNSTISGRPWSFEVAFPTLFQKYEVPTCGGGSFTHYVVNPLRLVDDSTAAQMMGSILGFMSDASPAVVAKRDNTEKFLSVCMGSKGQLG